MTIRFTALTTYSEAGGIAHVTVFSRSKVTNRAVFMGELEMDPEEADAFMAQLKAGE